MSHSATNRSARADRVGPNRCRRSRRQRHGGRIDRGGGRRLRRVDRRSPGSAAGTRSQLAAVPWSRTAGTVTAVPRTLGRPALRLRFAEHEGGGDQRHEHPGDDQRPPPASAAEPSGPPGPRRPVGHAHRTGRPHGQRPRPADRPRRSPRRRLRSRGGRRGRRHRSRRSSPASPATPPPRGIPRRRQATRRGHRDTGHRGPRSRGHPGRLIAVLRGHRGRRQGPDRLGRLGRGQRRPGGHWRAGGVLLGTRRPGPPRPPPRSRPPRRRPWPRRGRRPRRARHPAAYLGRRAALLRPTSPATVPDRLERSATPRRWRPATRTRPATAASRIREQGADRSGQDARRRWSR